MPRELERVARRAARADVTGFSGPWGTGTSGGGIGAVDFLLGSGWFEREVAGNEPNRVMEGGSYSAASKVSVFALRLRVAAIEYGGSGNGG